jgi:hypothetical protein
MSSRLRQGPSSLRIVAKSTDAEQAVAAMTGLTPAAIAVAGATPTGDRALDRVLRAGMALRRLGPTRSAAVLSGEQASPDGAASASGGAWTPGFDADEQARKAIMSTSWGPSGGSGTDAGVGMGGGNNGAEDGRDPTADLAGVRTEPLRLPSLVARRGETIGEILRAERYQRELAEYQAEYQFYTDEMGQLVEVPPARPQPQPPGVAGDEDGEDSDCDVVSASGASSALFAALMEALTPTLAAVGGPGCTQQLLSDYAELKRKLVQYTRTSMRQAIIRENRALREQGYEPEPMDREAIEAQLPKSVHEGVRRVARQAAVLQRVAGEAVRLHRRLCALEGRVVDSTAEAALAAALASQGPSAATDAATVTATAFRSGLLTREQRRVLLADATARLQAHAGGVAAPPPQPVGETAGWALAPTHGLM